MFDISSVERVLFVSNMGDDSISVIDVANRREIYKISLLPVSKPGKINSKRRKGEIGPHSLKTDSARKNLYSVNCFDDSISVIDMSSCSVIESFSAGSHPNDLTFTTDESYMYVTNGDSDRVSIIESSGRKIIGQVSVGNMPHGICISPDGEYVYVANMESASISIIDTWSNSKVSCIKVGKSPIEVMPSKDGKYLYVTCGYLGYDMNGMICVISMDSLKVMKNIEVGAIPARMGITYDNKYLWVTNMGSNNVSIIDLNRLEVKGTIKMGNMSCGITSDSENHFFIANSEDNNIMIVDMLKMKIIDNIEVGIEPTSMLYVKKTTDRA